MPHIYISIGSNIEPLKHIRAGVQSLRTCYGNVRVSPVYESVAVGFTGDNFYNLVAEFETQTSVRAVSQNLAQIELDNQRQRDQEKFASRTLDLDLLLYGDLILQEGKLSLPREEILTYAFVLCPLADLIPDAKHPLNGQTYAALWQAFAAKEQTLWQVNVSLE